MQLRQLETEGHDDDDFDNLKRLARGPDNRTVRYSGCMINGHRFRTTDRDSRRKTQNSGIVVKADHNGEEMNFYGVLRDVFKLSYGGRDKHVFLLKCDWWDIGSRSRLQLDEFKFISIKATKTWYKNDPYVLAAQAEGVIYLPDPKMGKSWLVVEKMQPRNLYDDKVTKPAGHQDNEAYQQNDCDVFDDLGVTEEVEENRIRIDMDAIPVDVDVAINNDLHDDEDWSNNDSSFENSEDDI